MPRLILASSSPYRAALLERLQLEFSAQSPAIDESLWAGETPEDYVCRLAIEKAQTLANDEPDAIIIGSDQCSECRGEILGKPHTVERAVEQLCAASGQPVTLWTAVAVYDPATGRVRVAQVPTQVQFRRLALEAIQRYVNTEQPLDCAGAFKAEGLGITLFERVQSDDPNAILGLPLIALTRLLAQTGLTLP
ncbi:MAG: nucleoside triphosphate pyrophosphatase [Spiribacter sp.]|jgi:septum formation protein|nr:nucleoside triphosphate pyrophosphatase [Spiribacter sp.]MDR9489234.1 nucleoside triphosphate pyrophosphatase [Spiribacter sp.]